jgi:hypothetical protein
MQSDALGIRHPMSAVNALGGESVSAFGCRLQDREVGSVLGVERFYSLLPGQRDTLGVSEWCRGGGPGSESSRASSCSHLRCTAEGLHRGINLVDVQPDKAAAGLISAESAIGNHLSDSAVRYTEVVCCGLNRRPPTGAWVYIIAVATGVAMSSLIGHESSSGNRVLTRGLSARGGTEAQALQQEYMLLPRNVVTLHLLGVAGSRCCDDRMLQPGQRSQGL